MKRSTTNPPLTSFNLKKLDTGRDSLDEMREDFNKNMKMIGESTIRQSIRKDILPENRESTPHRIRIEEHQNYSGYEVENLRLELGNMELRLKVIEDEKRLASEEIVKLKDEVLVHRENNLRKDREIFEKTSKIHDLQKALEKAENERDKMSRLCTELKSDMNTLQNRIIRQGEGGTASHIEELERQVRELSSQLDVLTQIKRSLAARLSPSKMPEESKMMIEGINMEQPGRPYSAFAPPMKNSERQTYSQQRIADKIKKDALKPKTKVRNYKYKD